MEKKKDINHIVEVLYAWLNDISITVDWDDVIKVYGDIATATLYTEENEYTITVTTQDYLGCSGKSRKRRLGEDYCRTLGIIVEGDFSDGTWVKIISAILGEEIITKY
jgi:hypothetical protein